MEADSKDMNIEQLTEKNTGLDSQIKMLQSLVPNSDSSILQVSSK